MTTLDELNAGFVASSAEDAGEPTWLRDRRLEANKRFVDQDWPDSREDEYWRSTPFAKRFDTTLPIVDTTVSIEAPDGVVVAHLRDAATDHEELVREHLGSLTTTNPDGTGADEDRTITASDVAWRGGAFVHVPNDVEVDEPIVVTFDVDEPGTHLPRVLVVLGRFAKATVVIEHESDIDDRALVNEVVEVVVGDGANLDLVSLQEWDGPVDHLSLQKAALHRDATYRHLAVNIGGATVRLRPEVDLVGPGASCFPLGVYFADDGQWFDMQPYIRHIAPHATSDVLYKGALQGGSRTVFRGNVFVGKDAVGTVTDENNRSLILTDGARADATPFLEIECAEIQAGHGSATGQLDANQLFYLESRGLTREQAVRQIVFGFFREVLERFELPEVQERAMAHIEHEIELTDFDSLGVSDTALPTEARDH